LKSSAEQGKFIRKKRLNLSSKGHSTKKHDCKFTARL